MMARLGWMQMDFWTGGSMGWVDGWEAVPEELDGWA